VVLEPLKFERRRLDAFPDLARAAERLEVEGERRTSWRFEVEEHLGASVRTLDAMPLEQAEEVNHHRGEGLEGLEQCMNERLGRDAFRCQLVFKRVGSDLQLRAQLVSERLVPAIRLQTALRHKVLPDGSRALEQRCRHEAVAAA